MGYDDTPLERDYRASHTAPGRGVTYDTKYSSGALALYWQNFETKNIDAIFRRLANSESARYLDFACGTGRILQLGAPHFKESFGIDVSEPMLREARRKIPLAKLICADVTRETVDLGEFDVVTLFRFLLNAEPDLRETVLRWLRSVIKKDGVLIANNHRQAWSVRGLISRSRNALGRKRRRKVLSEQDAKKLLARCGFRIEERLGFGLIPTPSNHLILPASLVIRVERVLATRPSLQAIAENQIYVCRPI